MNRAWSSLTTIALCFGLVGCGNGDTQCVNATSGMDSKSVANTLTLPMSHSDFPYDLNGDGKPDNQLGNIVGALSMMLNVQMGVDDAIKAGSVILLVDESASDLTNNDCAAANVQAGQKSPMPDFSGAGMFSIDPGFTGGAFKGRISGSKFASNTVAGNTVDTAVSIQLPLVMGADPIKLTIHGAHLQFVKGANGVVSNGQINGGIKNDDVQNSIIPTVATLLTQRVMAGGMTNATLAQLFDTGGGDDGGGCKTTKVCGSNPAGSPACKNPPAPVGNGMCADGCDMKVDICEVKNNPIIKNVLAPDVQLFDTDGVTFKPNKDNTKKDSLSLGLGFSGVGAKF